LTSVPPVVEDDDVVADEPVVRSDRHDIVEYDLAGWTDEQLRELESQLGVARIPHEWANRHLEVPGDHEAAVDDLVDAIDGLTQVADDVQYEFQDWTPEQCQQLVDRLLELDIACRWDGYLLGVGTVDEAVVDAEVLKIDPSFPIDGSDEEPPPDPPSSGWGGIIGDIAGGLLGNP
jgi:hypothetical protein